MKITAVEVVPFEVSVPRISFGELLPDHKIVQTITNVVTDDGVEGYYLGGQGHGDQDGLAPATRDLLETKDPIFWEVTDRQVNIDYVDDTRKRAVAAFVEGMRESVDREKARSG